MSGDRDELEAQAHDRAQLAHLPPGVRHLARWVRLCERQGTRMVDVFAAWQQEAARRNDIAERSVAALERLADSAGRLAQHADGYLGDPDTWHEPEEDGDGDA